MPFLIILFAYLRLRWYSFLISLAAWLHQLALKIGKAAQKKLGLREDRYYKIYLPKEEKKWIN